MRFRLNRATLLKELNLLQGIVEKKTTIPVLSSVLIEAVSESLVSLVATDLDVSLQTECAADVSEIGSVVLQARRLFDLVRYLPDAEIEFAKEANDWTRITCAASEFRLAGQAKEHFPSTPKPGTAEMSIPPLALHNLISKTVYAITQEESRYALSGALLTFSEGKLRMVATDGHRLALADCGIGEPPASEKEPLRVIIPKKALTEVLKLTTAGDEDIEFSTDANHLYFKQGQRHLTSRMLAGQFPNYDLVLPKGNDKTVTLNTEKIAQAVRRAALMADERSHGIKYELSQGKLNISSQSADVGESRESIAVDYSGADLTIGFNAQYLLDFLGVVATEEIVFELKDEQSPALMKPAGEHSDSYRYVVMPMRLL